MRGPVLMFALNIKKWISNCGFDSVFSYGFLLMFLLWKKYRFIVRRVFGRC